MKIFLRDQNEAVVAAWRADAGDGISMPDIEVGDPAEAGAVALVSPANSFGFMDGGIDQSYAQRWPGLEQAVRYKIQDLFRYGELLVGEALDVQIPGAKAAPWRLIVAPTMRVPMRIVDPADVYLATRAAVRRAMDSNLESLAMPGMGTGSGQVSPVLGAQAMMAGIRDGIRGSAPVPQTTGEAREWHMAFSRWLIPPEQPLKAEASKLPAALIGGSVLTERARCLRILQRAREGEIDGDLRALIARINDPRDE